MMAAVEMLQMVEAQLQVLAAKTEPGGAEDCGPCYRSAVNGLELCGDLRAVLAEGSAEGKRVATVALQLWCAAIAKGWTVEGEMHASGGAL